MKIDRNLNLVLPIELDEGTAHVHSTPIDEAVFDRYFMTITRTYSAMLENGGSWMLTSGPQVAARMLERIAEQDGTWEGPQGVEIGLMAEIRRRTNILALTPQGWDMIPLQSALDKGFIRGRDASEVENAVTFFTVLSSAMRQKEAESLLTAAFGLRDGQMVSSNCSAYMNFLRTSTQGENTGAKAAQ